MTDKIYSCVKCGQVYYYSHPETCMKGECISTMFEIIKKEDVIDMHDYIKSIFKVFLEFIIKTAKQLLDDLK